MHFHQFFNLGSQGQKQVKYKIACLKQKSHIVTKGTVKFLYMVVVPSYIVTYGLESMSLKMGLALDQFTGTGIKHTEICLICDTYNISASKGAVINNCRGGGGSKKIGGVTKFWDPKIGGSQNYTTLLWGGVTKLVSYMVC